MSQFNDTGYGTKLNGTTAHPRGTRVVITAGVLEAAGNAAAAVGYLRARAEANQPAGFAFRSKQGTVQGIAADAITEGADVYAAANGQVSNAGTVVEGTAMHAAGAGELVEILPA